MKKILVTCAFPYANGDIHLGHLLEHIQADIWVRYKRMTGNIVYFICADDAHGTPIMLKANKLGIQPEQIIFDVNNKHKKDLYNFNISYDNYYTTHSKENLSMLYLIYNKLKKKGLIKKRIVSQLYDEKKGMFLPDRFVKGNCPKCFSDNQYGDNCEICGEIYNSKDLINPKSVLSNSIPVIRNSEHFFFDLPSLTNMLNCWINSGVLNKQIMNKTKEWFKSGLKEWNISRDKPYFGFKIPDSNEKYFYVWMDATIGYLSTFLNLCNKKNNINFESFWCKNSDAEIYHFIGKDIIYFHSLFWPAILESSDFRKPTKLFVHGHLTINGLKMSKSRKSYINACDWLKYLDADSLRYYYASKLSSKVQDIDLKIQDFVGKINSDIVNKIINLASRNASFINKIFSNILSDEICNKNLHQKFIANTIEIFKYYNELEYNKVIKKIMSMTNLANQYIDEQSPWLLVNIINKKKKLHNICTMGINLFRIIMVVIKPIMPVLSSKAEIFLNTKLNWDDIDVPLLNHKLSKFEKLYNRIEINKLHNLL